MFTFADVTPSYFDGITMRHVVLIISAILLTSCALPKAPSLLEQGQQCWSDTKAHFTVEHPDSPAAWWNPDNYTPTPKDLRSKAKVTELEKQDLTYLIKAYQNCYYPPLKLTGDPKYDDYLRRTEKDKYILGDTTRDALIRTSYLYNFEGNVEIILYVHGSMTRGEYFRRYAEINSRLDAETQKELTAIKTQAPIENTYPTSIQHR